MERVRSLGSILSRSGLRMSSSLSPPTFSLPLSPTFDNALLRSLPIDPIVGNDVRPVAACFSRVTPTPVDNPRIIAASDSALRLIGLNAKTVMENPIYAEYFAGNRFFEGSEPNAHCYCGHQFGSFAGQLGDGRAISLGESINNAGERWEIQLKGAGKTPYSRFADGRAVLRSSIREYLCSEHMAALGIPTTRAGTLVVSDTMAVRDPLYNGNQILEKCAIVSRISPNFLRFGSWEVFVASGDREGPLINKPEIAGQMLDHVIEYFFKDIHEKYPLPDQKEQKYLAFYEEVVIRTANLVADWQLVGFTHGVLNTDNMSILGLTIDYGPFGFLDRFNPMFTPNTTDEGGRYRYEAQPAICKWNLMKLAEGLKTVVPREKLMNTLHSIFDDSFNSAYVSKMRTKLGLLKKELPGDLDVIFEFLQTHEKTNADFTNTFRTLSKVEIPGPEDAQIPGDVLDLLCSYSGTVLDLLRIAKPPYSQAQIDSLKILKKESPKTYQMIMGGQEGAIEAAEASLAEYEKLRQMTPEEKKEKDRKLWSDWLKLYTERLKEEVKDLDETEQEKIRSERKRIMNSNNPKFILRNYLLQNVIKDAEKGNYESLDRLAKVMLDPFSEHEGNDDLGVDGNIPDWACNSVLSCSS